MGWFPEVGEIWLDGERLAWNDARVHVATHGLHYGTGVFEGIRFYATPRGSAVFRLDDHLRRFERSAERYRMRLPYGQEEVAQAIRDVIASTGLEEGYVRPLAFYGYGNLGILPRECPVSVAVLVYPFPMYLARGGLENGIKVTVSPWRKTDRSMIPSDAKGSGQYLNSFLALSDARQRGFEEALLLNARGTVAEGTGENLFLVRDGRLLTNDVTSSILPGITRDSVLQLAGDLGIPAREDVEMQIEDVLSADEAFFTGTAAEITPIRELDATTIGEGRPGPITRRLQQAFFETVRGENPRRLEWLTYLDEAAGRRAATADPARDLGRPVPAAG